MRRGAGATRLGAVAGGLAGLGAVHAAVNARLLRVPRASDAPIEERVSVLLPVRDEAHQVQACLRAVLASTRVPRLEVLVLDDGSTDGTAGVVERVAATDARVTLLRGQADPPPGWLGKPWACARLADRATGSVLVFVDADVRLAPDGLTASVGLLRSGRLDLVSPYPRQLADGLGPRLVQPLLQWSWLTFLPLRLAERLTAPALTAANGQLLVLDAEAYRQCGGHAAVASEVVEDVALARAAKRSGLRVALADGTAVATCRMYEDWPALREGYTKSLWSAFGPGRVGAAFGVALLALTYLVPPVLLVIGMVRAAAVAVTRGPRVASRSSVRSGDVRLLAVGGLGTAAGVLGRVLAARRTGGRVGDALAHPASVAVLLWLVRRSRRARRRGALSWKGRVLPVGRA